MEDQIACNLIARSIGSVMRQSLADNFRDECKRLLGATNTHMVEENLFERLMELAQNGSTNATKQPLIPVNLNSASAALEKPLEVKNVPVTNMKIQENLPISDMYRQTIQHRKHSLSPQPVNGNEKSLIKLWKGQQSSAFFKD